MDGSEGGHNAARTALWTGLPHHHTASSATTKDDKKHRQNWVMAALWPPSLTQQSEQISDDVSLYFHGCWRWAGMDSPPAFKQDSKRDGEPGC